MTAITVYSQGNAYDGWVKTASDFYLKRLQPLASCDWVHVPSAQPKKDPLIKQLNKHPGYLVALDEKGPTYTSEALATQLEKWMSQSKPLQFVIGPADGLSEEVRLKADQQWSLSPLTFTHQIACVLMLEQLYRSMCILNNHPYHRA